VESCFEETASDAGFLFQTALFRRRPAQNDL